MTSDDVGGLVFLRDPEELPVLQVWINFGIFAGRSVTPAEIDRLAHALFDLVPRVTIVSEERHEVGTGTEASVHQVRIEVRAEQSPEDPIERLELEQRLIERARAWASACTDGLLSGATEV